MSWLKISCGDSFICAEHHRESARALGRILRNSSMEKVEVVAAIIENQDKILCLQRGMSKFDYIAYKYEFPGGKVEEGESQEGALKREIREELKYDIKVEERFMKVEYHYQDFILIMDSFLCSADTTTFILIEHIDYQWLNPEEFDKLDWAAADIPIVEKLMQG